MKLKHTLLTLCAGLILAACGAGPGATTPNPAPVGSADTQIESGLTYAPSGKKLDLCRPADTAERRTGIIFIHGGGFKTGNRQQMSGYCSLYAKGGFTAVTIDYRLSGEAAYPAALEDTNAAIKWMKANAAREGIDPNSIILVGYSAGGSLALMAGRTPETQVAGRVSVAGIADFDLAIKETKLPQLRKDLKAFLGSADPKAISPVTQTQKGDAPIFLFHGKDDKLVPVSQAVIMADAAKAGDVKVLLRVFDNAGHEIMLPNPKLKQLLDEMTRFLVAIDEEG